MAKTPGIGVSATTAALTATRLPPLKKLRVRRPNKRDENPCEAIMLSVLTCWASSRYNMQGCTAVEQSLRACMDTKRQVQKKQNTINYHLSRFYPQFIGPHKKKK